jgi:hypothetical protein
MGYNNSLNHTSTGSTGVLCIGNLVASLICAVLNLETAYWCLHIPLKPNKIILILNTLLKRCLHDVTLVLLVCVPVNEDGTEKGGKPNMGWFARFTSVHEVSHSTSKSSADSVEKRAPKTWN